MRECCHIFHDKRFTNKLNSNPFLFGCNNGVLDFKTKTFREGRPDDCITITNGLDYREIDSGVDQEIVEEINAFMKQLFPNKSLRRFMFDYCASCLIGTNSNQTFAIFLGGGRNGKSKFVELIGRVMGEYKGTMPIQAICTKRTSIGQASPEIAALEGTRLAVMQEPSVNDIINDGVLKELTGSDPITARALYGDPIVFKPQFNLAVCTNTLMGVRSTDDGTWRRMRVCPFESKFVENPNPDPEKKEFKVDKIIDEKFDRWAPVCFSMLANRAFETDGHVEDCSLVLMASNQYRDDSDYMKKFFRERLRKEDGASVGQRDVMESFRDWYQMNHGPRIPKGKLVYDALDKYHEPRVNGKWEGLAIVFENDTVNTTITDSDLLNNYVDELED